MIENNTIEIKNMLVGTDKVNAVSARDLHTRLCVGRDFTTWIKQRLEECMALEGIEYSTFTKFGETATGGYRTTEYLISLDCAKHICMLERTDIGRQMRQYFIDVEKSFKATKVMNIDQMIANPAVAIKLLQALQIERIEKEKAIERERLERELKERAILRQREAVLREQEAIEAEEKAIKEKAWISEKREATAMATASVAIRKVEKLKQELGESTKYATVLKVSIATKKPEKEFKWRLLKKACEDLEIEPKRISDPRFGYALAYPADAWWKAYRIDLEDLF